MSKRCINCGAELPDHAKFCNKCGATVPEQNSALFCPKCGAKLESGTKFCGSCGTPIGGAANTASAGTGTYTQDQTGNPQPITDFSMVRPKKKNWTKVLAGIGIVVVILFVIGILSEDKASSIVQNGTLDDYSDKTVGEAFEERFLKGSWSSENSGDITYVTFTGYDSDTVTDWEIVFKVLDNRFRVESIAVDGKYYTDALSISALLEYVYTGNTDSLLGYAFLQALFS